MKTATLVNMVSLKCKINHQTAWPNEMLLNHLAPNFIAKSYVHSHLHTVEQFSAAYQRNTSRSITLERSNEAR